MKKSRKKRVAIVNTHPIQYFAPSYAYLSGDPDIDLEVLYLSDFSLRNAMDPGFDRLVKWDIDLLSGYKSRFIGRSYRKVVPQGFFSLISPEVFGEIYRSRYDAILVHGYAHAANLIAIAAAKLSGAKVFFRADTNGLLSKKKPQSALKRIYAKSVFSACDRILTIGTRNREFYLWMGIPEAKLVHAPFAVDNERFFLAGRMSETERIELRRSLGIDDERPVILFLSKFMRGKYPDLVVQAAGQLAEQGSVLHLVMGGSGEMDVELRNAAEVFPNLSISFPGFVNQSEVPRLLGACDILVFPSAVDQWGLIVNEAMAVGLPVVVGADSGCAPDLVEDGVNGYLVPSNDLDALKRVLRPLIADAGLRQKMSKASLEKIATWSFREYHAGWREALGLPTVKSDERADRCVR